jgi:hypothetical protein
VIFERCVPGENNEVSFLPRLYRVFSLALASPALAKISIQKGADLCKAEIAKQDPAQKAVRVCKESARVNGGLFLCTVRVKNADDNAGKLLCTIDRRSGAVSVARSP